MIKEKLKRITYSKLLQRIYKVLQSKYVIGALYLFLLFFIMFIHTQLSSNETNIQPKWMRKSNLIKTNESNVYKDSEPNNEWEPLHQKLFIRRSASFYIPEKRLIRTLAIGEAVITYNIDCLLFFEGSINNYNKNIILKAKTISLTTYNIYATQTIDCYLPANFTYHYNSIMLYLTAIHEGQTYFTRRPIEVVIKKRVDLSDSGKPLGKIMLCSKQYNFTLTEFKNFHIWIDLNKKLGYEKLLIYNNSIPDENFTQLFKQYKKFVEIREYKYYPHLYLDENASKKAPQGYQYHLKDLSQELRRVHERLAINECYLSYRNDYDKIAILDYDEIIMPRMLANMGINNYDDYKTNTCNLNPNGMSNFVHYFTRLHTWYSKTKTFWFIYAYFLDDLLTHTIMSELKSSLEERITDENPNFEFQVVQYQNDGKTRAIRFTVQNQGELTHAKKLLEIYDFLARDPRNLLNKKLRFHRLLALIPEKRDFRSGKSIHVTKNIFSVAHHHTYEKKETDISHLHGFTSHFRTFFNFPKMQFRITALNFDLNYLHCYLSENNTFNQ